MLKMDLTKYMVVEVCYCLLYPVLHPTVLLLVACAAAPCAPESRARLASLHSCLAHRAAYGGQAYK